MKSIISASCFALLASQGLKAANVSPLGETFISSAQSETQPAPVFTIKVQNPISLANPNDTAQFDNLSALLALYSSDTVLNHEPANEDPAKLTCGAMAPVNVAALKDIQTDAKTSEYTVGELTGNLATGNIILEDTHWSTATLNAITGCSNFIASWTTNTATGIVGLGHNADAANNYKDDTKTIGINFQKLETPPANADPYQRNIYFKPFLKESIRGKPTYTLTVDGNNVANNDVKFTIAETDLAGAAKMNVIFDMNFDHIGIPTDVFTDLITKVSSTNSELINADTAAFTDTTCGDATSDCFKSLRDVTLTVGTETITFQPSDYVDTTVANAPVLAFKYLDGDKTPAPAWKLQPKFQADYVIIGKAFMKNHYTVFDGQNNKVAVYPNEDLNELAQKKKAEEDAERERQEKERKEKEERERKEKEEREKREKEEKEKKEQEEAEKNKNGNAWIWIVIVVVLVLGVAGGAGYWFWKKKQTDNLNNGYRVQDEEEVRN